MGYDCLVRLYDSCGINWGFGGLRLGERQRAHGVTEDPMVIAACCGYREDIVVFPGGVCSGKRRNMRDGEGGGEEHPQVNVGGQTQQ